MYSCNFLNCGLKQSAKIHALKLPPAPGFCGFPKLSGKPHICGKPLKIVFMLNYESFEKYFGLPSQESLIVIE